MTLVQRSEWSTIAEALGVPLATVAGVRRTGETVELELLDGSVVVRTDPRTAAPAGRVNEAGGHDRAFIEAMRQEKR